MPTGNILKFKNVPISSITPFTLQDFPNLTACILWIQGCNFACKYCYNIDLVRGKLKSLPFERVYKFLLSRINKLEGVAFSGGECTIHKNFIELVKFVKKLGFYIKIDTNGSNPNILQRMIENNLVNYVAIDYKAPINKYKNIANYTSFEKIEQSLSLLINSKIDFEVRTTVHTDLIDEYDINLIIKDLDRINYKGTYFIQNFKDGPNIGNLKTQKTLLNLRNLTASEKFDIKFRNFV